MGKELERYKQKTRSTRACAQLQVNAAMAAAGLGARAGDSKPPLLGAAEFYGAAAVVASMTRGEAVGQVSRPLAERAPGTRWVLLIARLPLRRQPRARTDGSVCVCGPPPAAGGGQERMFSRQGADTGRF
jgi:hypothetical protein